MPCRPGLHDGAHGGSHPLLGHRVRGIASGIEGEMVAVVREEVATHTGPRWTRHAYIGPEAGGRELPTALGNIEPLEAP
ncbi:hypothetical protein OG594_46160 [Streptomyces sp. NBC_01214]|uniref:hypothetical protein n=1 Tax=Streptomyces sp. NBC_01214 TaxID=2903777 RepID=UPI00224CDAEA|nr:hypothetical protein [Streptomyces sp. NBC_01214]MCX4808848.1 hypothetical protein [Streptomyces sp. NBC_01214]